MPRFFEIDNLATGDPIGTAFTLNVTATNSDAEDVVVSVSCPELSSPPPPPVTVSQSANPQPVSFALAHTPNHNDMTISVVMKCGTTVVDSEDIEEVDVVGDDGTVLIDANFFPDNGGVPGPATPIARANARDLRAGWYTGTYRRPAAQPAVRILVVRKTAARQNRIVAVTTASRFLLPTQPGGQDYKWEVYLPAIPAPANQRARLYVRALWAGPTGRVAHAASRKV